MRSIPRVSALLVRLWPWVRASMVIIDVSYTTVCVRRRVDKLLRELLWFKAIAWSNYAFLRGGVYLTRRGNMGGLRVLLFRIIQAIPVRLGGFIGDMLLIDGEHSVEGGLIDAAADIGLHIEQHFGHGENDALFEVLHDGVDFEDLAVHVNLLGDIYSLEEVEAESMYVFEVADLLLSPVPQDALVPADLGLEERDIPVGFGDVAGVVLYLPQHLNQYLCTLGLDHLVSHRLQDSVDVPRILSHVFEFLIFGFYCFK